VSPNRRLSEELGIDLDREEAEAIDALGERLAERPMPSAQFRADLNAHLHALTREAWRPRRPWRLATAYVASGMALLAIAAIGLAGAGPLGY
jgi:hypothetical protein